MTSRLEISCQQLTMNISTLSIIDYCNSQPAVIAQLVSRIRLIIDTKHEVRIVMITGARSMH